MTPHRLALGLVLFASRQLHVHGYPDDDLETEIHVYDPDSATKAGIYAALVMSSFGLLIGIVTCGVCSNRACFSRVVHQTVVYAGGPGAAPPDQQFPPQHPQCPPETQLPESSQPPADSSKPLPLPWKA
ncbi:uncharacterized protein LOC144162792 [Haemaphysalis longicornis]